MISLSLNVINPATRAMRTVSDEIPEDSVDALVERAKAVKKDEGGRLRFVLVIPRLRIEPHNIGGWVTQEGLKSLEEMIAASAENAQ